MHHTPIGYPSRNGWMIVTSLIGSLIVASEYNATFSRKEFWGPRTRGDPLARYISNLFASHYLCDIGPPTLLSTWNNGRSGDDYIAKRLDRYMVHGNLLDILGKNEIMGGKYKDLLSSSNRPSMAV